MVNAGLSDLSYFLCVFTRSHRTLSSLHCWSTGSVAHLACENTATAISIIVGFPCKFVQFWGDYENYTLFENIVTNQERHFQKCVVFVIPPKKLTNSYIWT